VARPSKLTPSTLERIVTAVRAGSFVGPACLAAGIAPSTYYRWMALGEVEETGPHRDFVDAIREAEAAAELAALAIVTRAMPQDLRAAFWYLERRHSERWQRRPVPVQPPEQPTGAAAPLDLSRLSPEDLELLEQLLARVSDGA
jgi:hypothetical protein